ncbi:acyl-CoA dehydrogenase family protein [Streptomyces sp. SAS_276]|uniref:acyl-CoA dehydrogenase family protein n=1 Tax=Streptomyces sp. SAS_276 TaxID=3412745 RepID=UPI00403C113F
MNAGSAIHLSIFGMHPVVVHGSEELKRHTLPRIASGDLRVCFGVTERGAGHDTASITTYPDGMTLFLTDIYRDRIDVRPIPKMGRNAVTSNELLIDDLRIPVEDRVGQEGQGFRYLLDGLNPERMLIAAEALGIGRPPSTRPSSTARSARRSAGPSPPSSTKFELAAAATEVEATQAMLDRAVLELVAGGLSGPDAARVKLFCTEMQARAVDRCLQLFGGYGCMLEYPIARPTRTHASPASPPGRASS